MCQNKKMNIIYHKDNSCKDFDVRYRCWPIFGNESPAYPFALQEPPPVGQCPSKWVWKHQTTRETPYIYSCNYISVQSREAGSSFASHQTSSPKCHIFIIPRQVMMYVTSFHKLQPKLVYFGALKYHMIHSFNVCITPLANWAIKQTNFVKPFISWQNKMINSKLHLSQCTVNSCFQQ